MVGCRYPRQCNVKGKVPRSCERGRWLPVNQGGMESKRRLPRGRADGVFQPRDGLLMRVGVPDDRGTEKESSMERRFFG